MGDTKISEPIYWGCSQSMFFASTFRDNRGYTTGYLRSGNLGWHGKPPHLLHSSVGLPEPRKRWSMMQAKNHWSTGYSKQIDSLIGHTHPVSKPTEPRWFFRFHICSQMFAYICMYSPIARKCNSILAYFSDMFTYFITVGSKHAAVAPV